DSHAARGDPLIDQLLGGAQQHQVGEGEAQFAARAAIRREEPAAHEAADAADRKTEKPRHLARGVAGHAPEDLEVLSRAPLRAEATLGARFAGLRFSDAAAVVAAAGADSPRPEVPRDARLAFRASIRSMICAP